MLISFSVLMNFEDVDLHRSLNNSSGHAEMGKKIQYKRKMKNSRLMNDTDMPNQI